MQEKKEKRYCYECGEEIPNTEGKYFCNQYCWDKYGKNFKPIRGTTLSIKEMQRKILGWANEMKEKCKPNKLF